MNECRRFLIIDGVSGEGRMAFFHSYGRRWCHARIVPWSYVFLLLRLTLLFIPINYGAYMRLHSRPLKKAQLPRSQLQIALDVLFKYASWRLKASALHLHLLNGTVFLQRPLGFFFFLFFFWIAFDGGLPPALWRNSNPSSPNKIYLPNLRFLSNDGVFTLPKAIRQLALLYQL